MISHILLATYPAFALHFQRRIPRNFVLIFPRIGSGSPPGPRCGNENRALFFNFSKFTVSWQIEEASFTIMPSMWKLLVGHWTIKLGRQTAALNKSFQSLVFVLTQLHHVQWNSSVFILFAEFDCPVAQQYSPLLPTAHDCEIGLLVTILGCFKFLATFKKIFIKVKIAVASNKN